MRLVFRADASPEMGTGHVMRSSAIAEEAMSRGIECIFVGDVHGLPWLEKRVNELGYSRCLPSTEIYQFLGHEAVLILDSYEIDPNSTWLDQDKWLALVSISDEITPDYRADLVVHPGLSGDWYKGDPSKFLFGTNFIPLRKSIRKSKRGLTYEIDKITVFGGGSDPYGFAPVIAAALTEIPNFKDAVIYSGLGDAISKMDSRYSVKSFGPTLDGDIESSDLVLTTASTSSLEVVARGIPVGIACAVGNQIEYFEALSNLGVAVKVGEKTKTGEWNIYTTELFKLFNDKELLKSLTQAGSDIISLNGAKNVIDVILKL